MKKHFVLVMFGFYLGASSAFAFDCSKASTPNEKAICADPAALAADTALSAAFKTLRAALPSSQSAQLLNAQKNWVKQRDNSCGEDTGAKLAACLKDQSVSRMAYLTAKPEAGTGAPANFLPYFQIAKGGKGKTAVDIQVYKFAKPSTPGQKAFNAEVDKLMADVQEPGAGDENAETFDYSVSTALNYASPKLISTHSEIESYFGGAHPNSQSSTINFDVKKSKVLQFKDFIDDAALTKISATCATQVMQQKKESQGADADQSADALNSLNETILSVSGDLHLWTFAADKASVLFDSDVVGAHAEGAFFCDIAFKDLRPMVKAGFPLP